MKTARRFAIGALVVICGTGLFWVGMASAGTQEKSPTCRPVLLTEDGQNYRLNACNDSQGNWLKAAPTGKEWNLVIDGGMANGSAMFAYPIPKSSSYIPIGWMPPNSDHPYPARSPEAVARHHGHAVK